MATASSLSASGTTIMGHYSVDNRYCATVYIQANTLEDATSKFQLLVGNTINACDKDWFSEAQFGSDWMPELSLATAFTSYGSPDDAVMSSVTEKEFRKAMKADAQGDKFRLLPGIDVDGFSGQGMNVYWCDVELISTVFFRADNADAAAGKRSELADGGVDLEYTRTWLYHEALDHTYFPYALSPRFKIVGAWDGWEVELRWPEHQLLGEVDIPPKVA
jgi:hypothetical protein